MANGISPTADVCVSPCINQPTPLQATISYGDTKESTPILVERQPLWNFWAQMPDQGGQEQMVFSVLERDKATGRMLVPRPSVTDPFE